jgi:hypothetical protein
LRLAAGMTPCDFNLIGFVFNGLVRYVDASFVGLLYTVLNSEGDEQENY